MLEGKLFIHSLDGIKQLVCIELKLNLKESILWQKIAIQYLLIRGIDVIRIKTSHQ